MEDDAGRDLFVRGVAAARAKDYAEARRYLEWSLGQDPPRERRVEALIWLAEVSQDPAEQRRFIEEALVYDPSEPRARRKLAILNGQLDPARIIDPDQVSVPVPVGEEITDARRFTCPNCGGRMVFSPDGRSLVCEYCATRGKGGGTGPLGKLPEEENFLVAMATLRGHANPVKTRIFSCRGCGTNFVLPPQQLSLTCLYCESAYVIENQQAAELVEPGAVIPFALGVEAARQAARAWLQAEQSSSQVRLVSGQAIYTPVWTFDLGGQISWRCEVKVSRDRWEKQTGEQLLYYNDLLVPASTHLSPPMRAGLDHFDLGGFKPYDPAYLADWPAETYQVQVSQAALEARQQAYQREQERARAKIFGQEVRNLVFSSIGIIVEAFKLALLPFWLVRAESNGRRFEIIVNGQTGRVNAENKS